MIASAGTGSTFGGLQQYLLRGQGQEQRDGEGLQEYLLSGRSRKEADRVAWTSTRNLPCAEAEYAGVLMEATARQNPRVQKPVYHLSLSASPGEEFSREQWERIADRVLRDLKLQEYEVLIVAHRDTKHQHIHLMINRVHPEHLKAWDTSHDWARIERSLRHLERDWNLREVPGRWYRLHGQERPARDGRPTPGERRERERTGEQVWAERQRFALRKGFKEARSWAELERVLARRKLRLERRGQGLVVTDGERSVKASRIDRGSSYKRLGERFGMSFEEWREQRRELLDAVDRYQQAERRQRDLRRRENRMLREVERAERAVSEGDRRRLFAGRNAAEIRRALRQIYRAEEVPAVERRLARRAHQVGWKQAGREIAEQPQRFGRLQLGRMARLRRPARRQLQNGAQFLGRVAGQRAAVLAARAVAGPAGFQAARRLLTLHRIYLRVRKRQERSSPERLLREVATRAAALGVDAVKLAIAPNPWTVVRSALRAAELAREAARSLGRGMGR